MKKKIFSLMMSVVMLAGFATEAAAQGKVTYVANANEFIFEPGSEYSETDLFTNFKNVMPGDTLEDTIEVQNTKSAKHKIRIYVRAIGPTEGVEDGTLVGVDDDGNEYDVITVNQALLDELKITAVAKDERVFIDEQEVSDIVFEDGTWFYIGTLYNNKSTELKLTLHVPLELDNDFQDVAGYVDWQFMVEEIPLPKDDPYIPDTGDHTNTALYAAMFGVCAAALVVIIFLKKKKASDEQ